MTVILHKAESGNWVVTHPASPDADLAEIAAQVVPDGVEWIAADAPPSADHIWGGSDWVIDHSAILDRERAAMKCSRLQGRIVLGEATCDRLDAIAADDLTPWAMRQTIQNAIEWNRTSQAMTELGYLLGYSDAQMDDLFRLAMTVDV